MGTRKYMTGRKTEAKMNKRILLDTLESVNAQQTPSHSQIIGQYFATADAIAELLRPHAEVVVHDARTGKIAHIANAFSKRIIGDQSLIDDGEDLESQGAFFGPYEKENVDGRSLRSITVLIKDFENQTIGYLCVNLDLAPFDNVRKAVESLLQFSTRDIRPTSFFAKDWREQIDGVTAHFLREKSCTLSALTKADRVVLVARIDEAGLFEARGAAEYVARQLEVSRAALYRYLAEARNS